ncbi:Imm49 family immunity protein [Kitasatospora sp. NPDC002965]|uniref:immunity 49 family protein n=1 Tax=Kitasatospora sp. NPDC002965 TaxID=3154775 RepID=UPI0033B44A60
MRIERHQVGEALLSTTREDFTNRIGGEVRSMSRAGRMASREWTYLADEFVEYLGALSAERPALDTPEARAVLKDATESAAGAVAFAAYFPHVDFQVFLDYVNFGISYEPGEDDDGASGVAPYEWLDAFCLAILSDRAHHHGEAFCFARQKFDAGSAGDPVVELATGLLAQAIGVLDDEDASYPPSLQERLAAVDAALERVRGRGEASGEDLLDRPHAVGLVTLRALVAGDRAAFDAGLTGLLLRQSRTNPVHARPGSLLPLVPLALAALAYRGPGWWPAVDTDYLPRTLVTGFETPGPRVGPFGRDRRPDAVAALAAGPVRVERPGEPQAVHPDGAAFLAREAEEAFTPVDGKPLAVWRLASVARYEEMFFKARASQADDVGEGEIARLRRASRMAATVFRTALAAPGTEVEVAIDGRTLRYPATLDRDEAGPWGWCKAVSLALVSGAREDLAPLVHAGPAVALRDGAPRSAFASYPEALHDYLRGEDPVPATERALAEVEQGKDWGFFPPPVVLFSQLVEGDEESFNLALVDALEVHRDYYRVADRADSSDSAVDLAVLGLACHARRRGWRIRVDSPYLPKRLLATAEPFRPA